MLWLRWRLRMNQFRRGGIANTVLLGIAAVFLVMLGAFLFVGALLFGLLAVPHIPPEVVLFVWNGLVAFFLFSWMIGLLAELQRTEALSLDKFLHLPVSLTGAFIINYLSTLFSLTLLLFLPPTLALTLALALVKGPLALLAVPLLAAFVLMVTALTYQFQGWLAALMANPRRRRTVIVIVTVSFILLMQGPNLVINVLRPWDVDPDQQPKVLLRAREAELHQARAEGKLTPQQFNDQHAALLAQAKAEEESSDQRTLDSITQTVRLIDLVIPLGWLPLGASDAAAGAVLPALLGTLGMSLIGAASLWRGYRTTLRLYTGQFSAGSARAPAASTKPKDGQQPANFVERRLPWVDEPTAAVALGTLRSVQRAPEAKMLLIAPIILTLVFGGMIFFQRWDLPVAARPLLAFAALLAVLVCNVQLLGNQFGFDRSGFRLFVLSPAPRKSIILGKNLAIAPLAIGLGLLLIVLLQIASPMHIGDFLAVLPQALAMYLLFCLLANLLSILTPMRIAAGTLKPSNPHIMAVLFQLLLTMLVPFVLGITLIPLGLQVLLDWLGYLNGFPLNLPLSLVIGVGVVFLYRAALGWQGRLLAAREQEILAKVTTTD
jgi:hypothetical protein